jgi:iron complex outermembrane receptor protein
VYNADEFREIINTMAPDKANLLGTANTNWQDLILETRLLIIIYLLGLFDKIPYRLSIGHTENEGFLI